MYAPDKDGWKDSHSNTYVEQYLYDLENDPYEKNNLVKDKRYIEVRNNLKKILKRKMKQAGEQVPEILLKV